ncbi:hypothetical protein ASD74_06485 [Rhizobium sp. Root564]|nr:hypothetical protein ASD74_06485 [Rhizobium sp. Root564]
MWGELLTSGASLLGGLFGSKKKQTTTSEVDYSKMAANAQAAGFNPLTAIRNGGSAGFTTTTSPTISAMPEVLGNLGGILGNALDKKLDPIEAKKREIDTILLDRQLGQLKMGPQVPGGWKPRSTFEGTKVSTQLAPRVGPSATTKAASVPAPNYKKDDAKIIQYGDGTGWQPNPWMPSADTIEQDFGDVAGSLYGVPKIIGDLGWNGYRLAKYAHADYKKRGALMVDPRRNARDAGAKMGAMFTPRSTIGPSKPRIKVDGYDRIGSW